MTGNSIKRRLKKDSSYVKVNKIIIIRLSHEEALVETISKNVN